MGEKVRFTISLDAEVHQAFTDMAEASGQSLSRVVSEWLRDTTDAARFVSGQVRQLRKTPVQALQELATHQDSAVAQTRALVEGLQTGRLTLKGGGPAADDRAESRRPRRAEPPSSPTGVKESRRGSKP